MVASAILNSFWCNGFLKDGPVPDLKILRDISFCFLAVLSPFFMFNVDRVLLSSVKDFSA